LQGAQTENLVLDLGDDGFLFLGIEEDFFLVENEPGQGGNIGRGPGFTDLAEFCEVDVIKELPVDAGFEFGVLVGALPALLGAPSGLGLGVGRGLTLGGVRIG
ncbi:MAG: hypothetical protein GY910_00475, partial [bacterium]|nr:hypothetical protein [bacterium]